MVALGMVVSPLLRMVVLGPRSCLLLECSVGRMGFRGVLGDFFHLPTGCVADLWPDCGGEGVVGTGG